MERAAQLLRMTGTSLLAGPNEGLPVSFILTNLFVELARGNTSGVVKFLRTTHGHVAWKNRLFSADSSASDRYA
ncbi:hypothetical protein Ciccas_013077 [Cichlidogyrus casuarinus]|uniref:Uncharacterized protein n=1 Tax=Cichlidogyrus casuarinus TaxID=1844966 RepID=A0ABD2PLJ0_9PLAT